MTYEHEDYEYDYEPLGGVDARILWGRIAVYSVAFVLVFLAGCWVGGGGDADPEELERLSEQVRELASENAALEEELAALSAGREEPEEPAEEPEEADDPAPEDEEAEEEPQEERTYTVEAGDTLYGIALKMYGDGSKWRVIAEENGLEATDQLVVGLELVIPEIDD